MVGIVKLFAPLCQINKYSWKHTHLPPTCESQAHPGAAGNTWTGSKKFIRNFKELNNKLPSLWLLPQHLKLIYWKDLLTLKKIKVTKPSTLPSRNSHDLYLPLGIWWGASWGSAGWLHSEPLFASRDRQHSPKVTEEDYLPSLTFSRFALVSADQKTVIIVKQWPKLINS